MFDLPAGYTLEDYAECVDYAALILSDKRIAESPEFGDSTYILRDNPEDDSDDEIIIREHGFPVVYFYNMLSRYHYMERCERLYNDIIVDCEGDSSNIAELPFKYFEDEKEDCFIGTTALNAAFGYIHTLHACTWSIYYNTQKRRPTYDIVKKNLPMLKNISSSYIFDRHDVHRIYCRISREYSIVAGRYARTIHLKLVTSDQIKNIIAQERNRSQRYSASWMSKYSKAWPKPKREQVGSSPREWDFIALKPILKEQFSDINWDKF